MNGEVVYDVATPFFVETTMDGTFAHVALSVAASARGPRGPAHAVCLVDCSLSMRGPKFALAKAAVKTIAEHMGPTDVITVVSFSAQADLVYSGPAAAMGGALDRIAVARGTNAAAAMSLSVEYIRQHFAAMPTGVVFLTDGMFTCGAADLGSLARLYSAWAPDVMHCIGVGADHAPGLLRALAGTFRGSYAFAAQGARVGAVFLSAWRDIAGVLPARDTRLTVEPRHGTAVHAFATATSYEVSVQTKLKVAIPLLRRDAPVFFHFLCKMEAGAALQVTFSVSREEGRSLVCSHTLSARWPYPVGMRGEVKNVETMLRGTLAMSNAAARSESDLAGAMHDMSVLRQVLLEAEPPLSAELARMQADVERWLDTAAATPETAPFSLNDVASSFETPQARGRPGVDGLFGNSR